MEMFFFLFLLDYWYIYVEANEIWINFHLKRRISILACGCKLRTKSERK